MLAEAVGEAMTYDRSQTITSMDCDPIRGSKVSFSSAPIERNAF